MRDSSFLERILDSDEMNVIPINTSKNVIPAKAGIHKLLT